LEDSENRGHEQIVGHYRKLISYLDLPVGGFERACNGIAEKVVHVPNTVLRSSRSIVGM